MWNPITLEPRGKITDNDNAAEHLNFQSKKQQDRHQGINQFDKFTNATVFDMSILRSGSAKTVQEHGEPR
jgi:hypothetical protein